MAMETLLAQKEQLMSKLTAGTATDDEMKTLEALMGLLERSVLVRSPSFCARMADRETLLAINAQLVSKLTAGTATDDDIKTLKAVMGLLEKEAAKVLEKRSISSSLPRTETNGSRRMASQLIKSYVPLLPKSGSGGQEWYGCCEIERMRAESDAENWGVYSDNPRIAEQLRTKQSRTHQDQEAAKRIVSADRALEARKDAEAAERVAAADRAMAAREKDHNSTRQRQREEERRREEEAASHSIPGGLAEGDIVASRVSTYSRKGEPIYEGDIGTVLGACTVDWWHRWQVSVHFSGRCGICDMLVSQVQRAGYTAREAKTAGFRAGYSCAEIKAAGRTCAEAKTAGYTLEEVKRAGYTAREAKTAGFEIKAGYTCAEIKAAGLTCTEAKTAGYTLEEVKRAGYTAREAKTAGFEIKAGYTCAEIKAAGLTCTEAKTAGYTLEEVKRAGYTAREAKTAGFEIKAGYTCAEVKPDSELWLRAAEEAAKAKTELIPGCGEKGHQLASDRPAPENPEDMRTKRIVALDQPQAATPNSWVIDLLPRAKAGAPPNAGGERGGHAEFYGGDQVLVHAPNDKQVAARSEASAFKGEGHSILGPRDEGVVVVPPAIHPLAAAAPSSAGAAPPPTPAAAKTKPSKCANVRQFDVPVNDTKLKSTRQAFIKKAAELKKQPAPEAAMETFQGAVGGAAAAATTTAIGIGGAMMTGATMGQAVGMMGGPMGMVVGAVGGALIGAAIGGIGLLSEDDMVAVPTVPSEALNPEVAKVGKPSVKEIEKIKAEKDVQPSPARPKSQQAEAFGSELPLPVIAGVRAEEEEEEWGLLQKYGLDPAKPPPNCDDDVNKALDATACPSGEDMAHGLNSASKPKPTPRPSQCEGKEIDSRAMRMSQTRLERSQIRKPSPKQSDGIHCTGSKGTATRNKSK